MERSATRRGTARNGRGLGLIVLFCVAVTAAACGGDPPRRGAAATTGAPAPASAGDARQRVAFAQCMRHNGVPNFPEPKGDAPIAVRATDRIDVRSAAFRKAQKACSPLLPGGSGPQASKAARTAAQKYARCMREHGVKDFPDPMGDGGLVIGSRSKIDPEGGPYQDAKAACDSALR